MNRLTLIALPLLLAGGIALGDDSVPKAAPSDAQLVKTCMDKQKSNTNVTMSDAELKRFCKDQAKQQKSTGAMPEKPPQDPPKSATPQD